MDHPWGYRNKAQPMTGQSGQTVIAGLHAMGTHCLIELSDCPVQHLRINETILKAKEAIAKLYMPVYDEKKRRGRVRTIVARVSLLTEEVQLTLVLAEDHFPEAQAFVQAIRKSLPYVVSINMNVQDQHTPLVFGAKTRLLWGKEKIEEALGHERYELSPRAFFQLNPIQTVRLYELVEEAAGLTGKESVVDAYAGVGTIALWLAPHAREVRGIESVPEAVKDAESNIRRSGYKHVHITLGRAEKIMQRWAKSGYKPDVVVVDPRRSGLKVSMIQAILTIKPRRLVYVSCNPSTLAKNAQALFKRGYTLSWVRLVDMFPQTAQTIHISILLLMRC
ncbi:MAG: RNA methyltransferase, TrmA family [Candidatus Carbobacillus altaicus]|uniref:RNA methyltransferase, TrmA family n=1 Tax=Candidatus Carbonibacillus altaicus TaxID=2163959 RepID=A0A2R6XXP7_9BACL|nr:MAG: RNA methyltransferase, TrmA family [Candidatus Carbobacillus altaicus]